MRKLATIRVIDKIEPIPGADKIVKATVGGWQLVTAIDNGFKEGDLVVYAEIDSWLPTTIAPFLSKGKEPREYNGIKGERLRTVKLRGQISQGLLLPMSILGGYEDTFVEGDEVTDALGIQKWEAPINAQLAGLARGNFPSYIPKTDQERIQNLKSELEYWRTTDFTWEVTEKLEGSSMTVYLSTMGDNPAGDFGVCSRNLDLKDTEGNTFWEVAKRDELEKKLRTFGLNMALQGELIGPGIQGNIYKLKKHMFMVFDIYDITRGRFLLPKERRDFCELIGVDHVPVFDPKRSLRGETMESLIANADGLSVMGDITGPLREGLVYKCNEVDPSFKTVSNKYLLGEKE